MIKFDMKFSRLKDLKIVHNSSKKDLICEAVSKLITAPLESFELQLKDGFWMENQFPPYDWDELSYMAQLEANKRIMILDNQIIVSSSGLAEVVKFFSAESQIKFYK